MADDTTPTFMILVGIGLFMFAGLLIVGTSNTPVDNQQPTFEQFDSEEEFSQYMSRDSSRYSFFNIVGFGAVTGEPVVRETASLSGDTAVDSISGGGSESIRQTNVQEQGVGESDIVKLVGDTIYYSPEREYVTFRNPVVPFDDRVSTDVIRPQPVDHGTKVLGTDEVPPEVLDEINQSGQILRSEDTVIVYNEQMIKGYDVSNESNPEVMWNKSVQEQNTVVTTRRIDDTAYFVLRERTSTCPVQPLDDIPEISCTEIYHPVGGTADSVYTAMSINMEDGSIQDSVSFVGGAGDTTVYMSENSLYVGYPQTESISEELVNHLLDSEEVSFDENTRERLNNLTTYELSDEARLSEMRNIIQSYQKTLPDEERAAFQTNVRDVISNYIGENRREIRTTEIMKLNVNNGEIETDSAGSVPGQPLNQFSFNEKDGRLRVATTVPSLGDESQTNDMYVLDENMNIEGSVKNMADGQRIYAVRYIGDKGYVITFRRVDPLHVIDLNNPSDPEEVGVLELPGFSRYLHPVDDGKIVGVGQSQEGNAKVVLFDVTDDENPKVSDSVVFESDFGTEVGDTHKAFSYDGENQVMYIPSSSGVRVVEYEGDEIEEKALIETESRAKRTRIVDDRIYVFHDNGVLVADRDSYETLGGYGISS